jgi:regulator of protease activity HflC (stomatin/prohibitin superfamily)
MEELIIGLLVVFGLVVILMIPNIKIVSKDRAVVIERLGQYLKTLDQPGVYVIVPLLDRAIETVPLDRIQQSASITIEEQTIHIDYTLQVYDVKLFVYGELSSLTSLRKYIIESYSKYHKEYKFFYEDINGYATSIGITLIDIQVI